MSEEDAYTSIAWRNDPEIWSYTLAAGRSGPALADELAWIRAVNAETSSRRFAITADGVYVGNTYLTGINGESAEYHIFIGDKAYWGKGVARAATDLILRHGWDVLGLARVHLIVHPQNTAAIRLYRSLGFRREGERDGFMQMSLARPDEAE